MSDRPNALSILAPAKVNLVLRVLVREESGFHQLETLFVAVDFSDRLLVERAPGGISVTVAGPPIEPLEKNLVYRAARVFLQEAEPDDGVAIHLDKRIPMGAGLGGGSSDAGATLKALNRLFDQPLSRARLAAIAGDLGADVPFFLSPSPLALAWGRGDRLLPLPPLESASILLAMPPIRIGTAAAYEALAKIRMDTGWSPVPRILDPQICAHWEAVAARAENDFEGVLFPEYPLLASLREALASRGARPALLSGSGSSLFGVFPSSEAAEGARDALVDTFPQVRFELAATLREMPRSEESPAGS